MYRTQPSQVFDADVRSMCSKDQRGCMPNEQSENAAMASNCQTPAAALPLECDLDLLPPPIRSIVITGLNRESPHTV